MLFYVWKGDENLGKMKRTEKNVGKSWQKTKKISKLRAQIDKNYQSIRKNVKALLNVFKALQKKSVAGQKYLQKRKKNITYL